MFLITGVTGHVGSAAATELLAAGARLRVLVRNADKGAAWRDRGAEVIVGELGDVDTLAAALQGVEGAFLLVPPPGAAHVASAAAVLAYQRATVDSIAAAVKRSGVKYVVALSSIGAHQPGGTGPIVGVHHLEGALRATGVHHVFVRACSFMENHGGSLGAVTGMGIFPSFFPADYPSQQVATRDIGHVVAQALLHPPAEDRVINLVGPREYSVNDVVAAFSAATGKPVQRIDLPLEIADSKLKEWGVPEGMADLYAEMYRGAATGHVAYPEGAEITRGTVGLETVIGALVAGGASGH